MRRITAVAGSAVFLVIAPGVVAGLIPWWLTGWQASADNPVPVRIIGGAVTAAGAATLIATFAQFVLEGRGTPAPPAPPEQLVVRGLYRYIRNPMYVAVLAVIIGQALLLGRPVLLGYAAVVAAACVAFVRWYEQPALARRYGAEYEAYRRAVPGWWPRMPLLQYLPHRRARRVAAGNSAQEPARRGGESRLEPPRPGRPRATGTTQRRLRA
jgi:protein-S-isoprenylcysteine O-methyltransferase Ste14